jgi:hypothetical protein
MSVSLRCNNAGSTRRAIPVLGDPTTDSFLTLTASTPTVGSGPLLLSSPSPEEPEPEPAEPGYCPESPPTTPSISSRESPISTCRPLLLFLLCFLPFCLRGLPPLLSPRHRTTVATRRRGQFLVLDRHSHTYDLLLCSGERSIEMHQKEHFVNNFLTCYVLPGIDLRPVG